MMRRREDDSAEKRSIFLLRQAMNLIFMVSVVLLIVIYFAKPALAASMGYVIFAMFVVLLKIAEMIIRFLPRNKKKTRNRYE